MAAGVEVVPLLREPPQLQVGNDEPFLDIRIDSNDLDAYITASRQEPEHAEFRRR